MGVIRVKDGVTFGHPSPAGFRLLGALDRAARVLPIDLTITCGSDSHPPTDPHTLGSAYDVRTHNLTPEQKEFLLRAVLIDLQMGPTDLLLPVSIGLAISHFYGQLENPDEKGEHLHFQQRKGVTFP